jgi:hypothetical protein
MRTIKYGEEELTVVSAAGYYDGCYWDMSATVILNDVEYSIQDAGSGSGYVPHYSSISVNGPKKLVTIMQLCESEEFDVDYDDWDYVEATIIEMLDKFFENGCKESYEEIEDRGYSYFDYSVHIDGQKREEETEGG